MAEAATSTFACAACGKQYKWKQELAGRKVKCKCGQVVQIPVNDPSAQAAPEEDSSLAALEEIAATKHVEIPRNDEDLYAMAEPEKPKRPTHAAAVGVGVGVLPAGPVLGYSRAPVADERDDNDPNALKELYIPIAVFAVGFMLSMLQAMKFSELTFPFQSALAYVGIRLVFDMVLITAGCLCVMSWLEVSFGAPGPALLKIAGIALIASPVADMISYMIHDPFGLVGRIISMVCIWILFIKMFDMDISDVRILAVIVWVVRVWAGYILLALIFSGMGVTVAGMGGPRLGEAELNSDRIVQDKIDLGRMRDATEWIQDGNHCFGKTPNAISKKLVDGLVAAGCTGVLLDHDGPYASELVAKLPSKDAQRAAAFAAANAFCAATGDTAPIDKGQTYLDMDFSMYYDPPTTSPSGAPTAPSMPRRRRMPLGAMNHF